LFEKIFQSWLPCDFRFFLDLESINYFLHGPTAFVLAFFFFSRWSFFITHLKKSWKIAVKLIFFVGLADGVTTVFYILFKTVIDRSSFPLWAGFFVSAISLFSLLFCKNHREVRFTWDKVLILGCVQGIAFLPGISRLGFVFATARWLGFSNKRAFEISFMIQWPLIAAAFLRSTISLYSDKQLIGFLFSLQTLFILFCASVVAFFSLWFVWWLAQKNKLWIFSLYLLVPTVLSLMF